MAIFQAHQERGDFGVADIRRVMAAIYAGNLRRSHFDSFKGYRGMWCHHAGNDIAMAMASIATSVVVSATSRVSAPYAAINSSSRMMDSSRSSVKKNIATHADSTNERWRRARSGVVLIP